MRLVFFALCATLIFNACDPANFLQDSNDQEVYDGKKPKNIILMIGDGMGLTQITAGYYRNGDDLNLVKFPVIGIHKPYASNDLITDSAAGATAFSTGKKTFNGAIGMDKDSAFSKTILEEAIKEGYATGLVATSTIVHATPAAFIAHVDDRYKYEDIAKFFLLNPVDYFVGGGKQFFFERSDGLDLLPMLQEKGYVLNDYLKEPFREVAVDFDRKFGYFTAEKDPLKYEEGRDYLVPASKQAPLFLKRRSDKGFFLMIEGSQIDWGGHDNDSEYIIAEMIDFDNAIGAVMDFAREDGETLVIVTADHETGGYAINKGSTRDSIIGRFTTDEHTASLIPVFAYGPGAELFGGIYENTAIYHKMKLLFDF
jgi:alkaline phosphatase